MVNEPPKRILIVKLSAIGDVLMATPAAKALRAAFPESYIAWVVERKSADVVLGNPYLDEVVLWDRHKSGNRIIDAARLGHSLLDLRSDLKARRFDVCVDLQGLLRSALVSLASGAKRRIGFSDAAERSTIFYTEKYQPQSKGMNAQQRNLDLLKPLGVNSTDTAMHMPVGEEDRDFARRFFEESGLIGSKVVAFCVATTWANKHWTPEGWVGVADLIWHKYGARTLILGSKADIPLVRSIADAAISRPIVSAGLTTLKQAGALMEKSDAVIGVDTGLLHMSVALDRPSIGLFGASEWRCFQKKDNFIWVAKDYPCSPCRRHPTCSNVDCMRAITPDDVEAAVRPWLE